MALTELVAPAQVELERLRGEEKELSARLTELRNERRSVEKVIRYLTGTTGQGNGGKQRKGGLPQVSEAMLAKVMAAIEAIGPASITEISTHEGKSSTWASNAVKVLHHQEKIRVHSIGTAEGGQRFKRYVAS